MTSRKPAVDKKSGDGRLSGLWCWVALALIIIGVAAIRWRLLSIPLERDEGEYAYIAQQMLKGVPPYESAYSMKLPGIYAVYAIFLAVFGQTITGIHMGLLIFNAATIFVIFLLTRRLFGSLAGVAAAAAYGIMSLTRAVMGLSANAEHFVLLPAIIGVLLIAKPSGCRNLFTVFIAAVLFGLAFIIKQHGIFFALFAGLYLLYCDLRQRPYQLTKTIANLIVFVAGAALPFVLICLFYRHIGVFDKFWFWTFTYVHKYVTAVPLSPAFYYFRTNIGLIIKSTAPIWGFAAAGLIMIFVSRSIRDKAIFTAGLLVFSFLSVCPGFYFREHYFILLLPAVAVLAGAGFSGICNLLAGTGQRRVFIAALAGLIAIGYSLFDQRTCLFEGNISKVCRQIYGFNPFPETLEIAKYIKQNTSAGDTIAVVGSEPQIYFYSDRKAATTYIYTYPLMELHSYAMQMQKEMIDQIERARPEFIVFVHNNVSWLIKPRSGRYILEWFGRYASQNYDITGMAEILSSDTTIYRWDNLPADYKPVSAFWLGVYRKRGNQATYQTGD